jgi:hypothetical protein
MNFHGTAKIYQFPRKALLAAGRRRDDSQPVVDLRTQNLPTIEFGSGWYHEAAVQDADRTRKL